MVAECLMFYVNFYVFICPGVYVRIFLAKWQLCVGVIEEAGFLNTTPNFVA